MIRQISGTWLGFVLLCLGAWALSSSSLLQRANLRVYDQQMQILRALVPVSVTQDVVIIGVDEASAAGLPEPQGLWHKHLGRLLSGLAQAQPSVVGLALPLPSRSYNDLIAGLDEPLLQGLRELRLVAPVVLGQEPESQGVQHPIAPLLLAVNQGAPATLALCVDADRVVRRSAAMACPTGTPPATLASAMARAMGSDTRGDGWIDFSVGHKISYVPLKTVLAWLNANQLEPLRDRVKGHPVIITRLLDSDLRVQVPVVLSAQENDSVQVPMAYVHAQELRSLMTHGLTQPVSSRVAAMLMGLVLLLWWGPHRRLKWLAFASVVLLGACVAELMLWHGLAVPLASLWAVAALAFFARMAWDTLRTRQQKQLLQAAFAGHISPKMMGAMLRGQWNLPEQGQRIQATLLAVRLRNFEEQEQKLPASQALTLLNRYLSEITAAIHFHEGTVDVLWGDGLMATFGVPQPLDFPQRNALEAAQDALMRCAQLSQKLQAEGVQPWELTVVVSGGQVLTGHVGATRKEFMVLGTVVEQTRQWLNLPQALSCPVVLSDDIKAAVHATTGLTNLGHVPDAKGRPVQLWGWIPELLALSSCSSNK